MYAKAGYYSYDESGICDMDIPVRIVSCGMFKPISRPTVLTVRKFGRKDYQFIYIASGKAYFVQKDTNNALEKTTTLEEGNGFLYLPNQPQHYYYHSNENTVVYWIHFTGHKAAELIDELNLDCSGIISMSVSNEIINIFESIIKELHSNNNNSDKLLQQYFYRMIHIVKSKINSTSSDTREYKLQLFFEETIRYFNASYSSNISIKEYAQENYMSISWFIRSFKKYQGVSPSRYIIDLRINKAKELLKNTEYNIGQIGEMVGYDNSLYFSRLFKKETGVSPREYRKLP